ncbi:molybdopterin molybdotransferase MoeA [Niabella sp. CC-SYL272]|uniref:molybdopterin molybdotransferase MoeA n=1 Tax=Niabella agricola TaxID=2891571 RepID=UPI001F1CEB2F|nr:molybdopterin molybdotransferase MoeA [Niabella agricola]MCF3110656.1 molybdopterin molybdotransferase MoeA [Niabella agricola]
MAGMHSVCCPGKNQHTSQWQQLEDSIMDPITVAQADKIIQSQIGNYGTEEVGYDSALGRILAENIVCDRDLPPFNRATVDGITIDFNAYAEGVRSFKIKAVQAAGEPPVPISAKDECIEIMTGAALDHSVNTVIRYEDIDIVNGTATIKNIEIIKGQQIHLQGRDKKRGDQIANADCIITPALLGLLAAVGKTNVLVKKVPRIKIITTGDEMIEAEKAPTPYQLRRSNGIVIKSVLEKHHVTADVAHLADDAELIKKELARCLNDYDVLLMSGGVSMGKFDYVPRVLNALGVEALFYKVLQRPGKPFWFGSYKRQKPVFAFPGNPVSVFMCLHRYFIPWLNASLGITDRPQYAVLQTDIRFAPALQYFVQVQLRSNTDGRLMATVHDTNGSGDFSHLTDTDAFMELPLDQHEFKQGTCYRIWNY